MSGTVGSPGEGPLRKERPPGISLAVLVPGLLWALVLVVRAGAGFLPVAGLWQGNGGPSAVIEATALDRGQVLAGGPRGLFASRDQGASWSAVNGLPEGTPITAVAAGEGRVYAASQARLWERSGESWVAVQAPAAGELRHLLLRRGQLLAAGEGGLYSRVATDPSADWRRLWPAPDSPAAAVFAVHDADDSLLLGTDDGIVLLEQDSPAGRRLGPSGARVLGIAAGAGWVYAAVPEPKGGLFRARAGSDEWQKGEVASNHGVAVIVDPRNPSRLLAGLGGLADGRVIAGVVESNDAGATWSPVQSRLLNTHVHALTLDDDSGMLYAGTNGGGLFHYREPTLAHRWLEGVSPLLDIAEPVLLGLVGLGLLLQRRRSNHR